MMMSRNEGEETDWGRGRGGEEPGSLPVYLSRWQACGETVRRGHRTAFRQNQLSGRVYARTPYRTACTPHLSLPLSLPLARSFSDHSPPSPLSLPLARPLSVVKARPSLSGEAAALNRSEARCRGGSYSGGNTSPSSYSPSCPRRT